MQLTTNLAHDAGSAWSPDGTRIAFASARSGDADIYVMPATGEPGAVRLTTHPAGDGDPAWSPDGTQIAFRSDRGGNTDIWAMMLPPLSVEPATWGAIKAQFR